MAPTDLEGRPTGVDASRSDPGSRTRAILKAAHLGEDVYALLDWLGALLQALPHPVFAKDLEGRYTLVNPAWEAALGLRADAVLGRTAQACWPSLDTSTYRAADQALLGRGGSQAYESTVSLPTGEVRDVVFDQACTHDADGRVNGLVGSFLDITERRATERALAASEARTRAMLEAAHTVAFVTADVGDDEPVVVDWSPGARRLFGWTQAEIVGKSVATLAADGQGLVTGPTGRQGVTRVRTELELQRRDGDTFPAMVTLHPLSAEPGEVPLLLMVAVDLSRVRAAERDREQLTDQLRHAQKLEALGALAGGVAHDFNNLLATILGHAESALDEVADAPGAARPLAQIVATTERARDLVRRLMTFGRRTAGERRALDPAEVVDEALGLVRATLPATVSIEVVVEPALGPVVLDPVQVQQLLVNLATNGWHAMPDGGVLGVRVAALDREARDPFPDRDAPAGRWVLLEVSDTGQGMDAKTVARALEPYFTTKEPGRGTGLGLAVVHGIVQSHGGWLGIESASGKGTTVRVLLPRENAPEGIPPVAERPDVAPGGSERVLLAEDEEGLRALLCHHLGRLGYTVTACATGEEAWAVLHADPFGHDLVLTDMAMPGMSGAELAARAMDLRPDLPVIVCTGFSEPLDEAEALRRGIRAFLLKPISRANLARALRKVLDSTTSLPQP